MSRLEHQQRRAPTAVLVAGVLTANGAALERAASLLAARYGGVHMASKPVPFTWSRYYAAEMGPELTRRFLAFEARIDPGALAAIKVATIALEIEHAAGGRRTFNLDPGYLTLNGLFVASTKEASYRVYLGGGIFAQPMLVYRHGRFEPYEWTYPDYADPAQCAFFKAVRDDAQGRGLLAHPGAAG